MPDGPLRGPSPSHRQQPTLVIEVFEIKAVRRTAVDCERQTTDEAVHAARRNALPQKSASNLMVVRPGSTLLSGSEVRFLASGPVARRTLLLPRGVGLAPRRQPVDASADANAAANAGDAAAAAIRTAVAAAEQQPPPTVLTNAPPPRR